MSRARLTPLEKLAQRVLHLEEASANGNIFAQVVVNLDAGFNPLLVSAQGVTAVIDVDGSATWDLTVPGVQADDNFQVTQKFNPETTPPPAIHARAPVAFVSAPDTVRVQLFNYPPAAPSPAFSLLVVRPSQ
jgi:hypothetical protein